MARFYHVAIAQVAANADKKWVDNLLSHFDIPGVNGERQGLARRISVSGIRHIALVRALCRDFGMTTGSAVSLATRLLSPNATGGHVAGIAGLEMHLDRYTFEREVDAAIADAVESVAPARRGRPPRRTGADG